MSKIEEECKGFLITCDQFKEKQAIKDAYNFLSQFIEEIYGDIAQQKIHDNIQKQGQEVNLQTEAKEGKKACNRILFTIETNVKCLVFIKINPEYKQVDPLAVVTAIMSAVWEQKRQVTRFCHRITPVEKMFKAEHFRMVDQIDQLFNQHTVGKAMKSWALVFKCRNNSKFKYKEVLAETEKIAKKYGHFADVYYPEWNVVVEITHQLMCLSIVDKFKEYHEFKLRQTIPKQQMEPKQKEEKPVVQKKKRDRPQEEKEGEEEEIKEDRPQGKVNESLMRQKIEVGDEEVDII